MTHYTSKASPSNSTIWLAEPSPDAKRGKEQVSGPIRLSSGNGKYPAHTKCKTVAEPQSLCTPASKKCFVGD